MSAAVVDVLLDRERRLEVAWEDGCSLDIELGDLREVCPCADCRGRRERGEPVTIADRLTALSAELHGNWGIAIQWSDGHETGIYGWEMLRTLAAGAS